MASLPRAPLASASSLCSCSCSCRGSLLAAWMSVPFPPPPTPACSPAPGGEIPFAASTAKGCPRPLRRCSLSAGGRASGKGGNVILRMRGTGARRKGGLLFRARASQGPNLGGGGGWDRSTSSRVVGNLALAIGLTYLTMTGQLGSVLDALVSIWLLAVLLPIVGLGAFFWFAGKDIVQSSCPSCGNHFQIFKSSLNDGPQLCPFCSQPFTVQDNKFVRESAQFSSDQSETYRQAFNSFTSRSEKGKATSATVVDVEAEVRDAD